MNAFPIPRRSRRRPSPPGAGRGRPAPTTLLAGIAVLLAGPPPAASQEPEEPPARVASPEAAADARRGPKTGESAPVPAAADTARETDRPFLVSPYLPLDHWAYPVLNYWISAGRIRSLSPLVRPYRRAEVAEALLRIEEGDLTAAESGWLGRLEEEFRHEISLVAGDAEPSAPWLLGRGAAGAEYRTQTHRDVLRPELDGRFAADRLLEEVAVEASGAAGPVAGAFRARRHRIYLNDAQFPDGRVVREVNLPLIEEAAIRVEEAYLEVQTRYARLSFGRMYRNWAPAGATGLLRSDYAYSFEELGYRFGTDRIFLEGSITSFADFAGDTTRYWAIHRLEARPLDELVIAVTEASLHGGPGENLDLRLVNPVAPWVLTRKDQEESNLIGGIDVWWAPSPALVLHGNLLTDATNTPRTGITCCQLGGAVGVELPRIAPGWILRARVGALQSLVYRTLFPWEEYSTLRVGLGWDKSDIVLAVLEADWFARGDLLLRPGLAIQLRGEGDFRVPHPPPEVIDDLDRILVGTAESTLRPAMAGRWRPRLPLRLDVEWDIGVDLIGDYLNVPGDDRAELVGRLGVRVESPDVLLRFR